ncbi:cactin-like [Acipenser oxyrinchus oxyrinchus]|uniref:Splicing factor Cactin n=1 Tax=Acipenser oxyrinchus oxyrinchus TaxID=40147 RepID=A0AAD8FSM4_ACIOX|nr:cactin-like [Acipenser oxyrinchus oxyrinchus]
MDSKSRRRSRSVSRDRHRSRRSRSQERKKRRERSRSGSRHRPGTGLGSRAARREVRSRSGSAGLRRSTSRSVSRRRSRSSSVRKSRSSSRSRSRDGLRRSRSKSRDSPAKRSQSRSSSSVRSGSQSDSDSGKSEGSRSWRRERKKASPARERRRSGSGDRLHKRKARKHRSEKKRETRSRRKETQSREKEREGREKRERESIERQRKETQSREKEREGRERESIERQRKETESRERERKERESHEQKNRKRKEKRDGERSVRESPERQERGRRERGSSDSSERERESLERREAGRGDSSDRERGRREAGTGDSSERERGRREAGTGDSSERERGRREAGRGDSSERERGRREAGRGDSSERERERSERGRKKKRGGGRSSPSGSSVTSGSSDSQSRSPGGSSSSSSSGGSSSRGRQQRKQEARAKDPRSVRLERHAREDILKAMETPEEKRARRLAKKEAKERKKREKMGWSEEYMGYTNADNPFGDNNLLGTFKWQKALELKGIGHLGEKDLKERNKRIQEENRRELQKVKQLRLEREREKAMREQELEMLQREKEAEHFKTWAEQEDNFHLHQAKLRSKIRIRDGRAKPIDLLAKYISAEDDDLAVEMHEPYTFLNGLTVYDMDDLLEDIKVYMELEQGKNGDFWRDMTIITEDEISKLRKLEASGRGPGDRREGINTSVSTDVQTVFKGKTYNQLQALHQNIEGKIRGGGSNLDIGYWESLMQQVKVYMARARLRERHQDVLRQKLYKLKQEQGVESEPLFPIVKQEPHSPQSQSCSDGESAEVPGTSSSTRGQEGEGAGGEGPSEGQGENQEEGQGENQEEKQDEGQGENQEEKPAEGQGESVLTEEDLIQQSLDDYDSGRYSPTLLQNSDLPLDTHLVEPEEDLTRLQVARNQMHVTGDASESAEDAFVRRARQGMGGDEAQFSVEMPLTGKVYLWADKYRPRKPRFFNRVHTGFEWNKYNQTHYDFDNPPPKIVQGYKFNIFYPDLIDKRSTPQYFLEPSQDNRDFGVLRFHAGPPYEDIAFKIVNREWEYSHRHGFRCQFANGIFQLWFHFKRYRYRR